MPDSYYTLIGSGADSSRFAARPSTVGPWAGDQQHGGPPNALAVACAETAVAAATDRADLVPLRLAAEFVGPVPVADLDVHTHVVRAARSAALVDVRLVAGDRDCLHARVWFVRSADTTELETARTPPPALPATATGLGKDFGYGASLEWRFAHGALTTPGPGAAWVRPATTLFEGYTYSGLARSVLIADSASGISSELDWSQWSFANVDLDVHLVRPPEGDWLLMDATTRLGPGGSAVATSTLSDADGVVGGGLQTLVVAALRR